MNNQRRKELEKAKEKLTEAREILDSVSEEESESLRNLPESFQDGEKGERMKEYIDSIDEVSSELENLEESIGDTIDGNL